MKISLRTLFAAAGMFLASIGIGRAEEVSLAPKFEPFSAPEITLVGHCTDGCADACADSCTDSCTSCCPSRHVGRDFWVCKDRSCGWVGGVDFLLLKPFAGGGFTDGGPGGPQLNYNPAYRITMGRQNADGLVARIRYFEFDRGASTAAGSLGVESRYFDAEMTQALDFRRSNLLFSGGLRYAEYQANNDVVIPGFTTGFYGVGLTFGAEATRDLNKSGSLRMVAATRWSAVYGNNSTMIAGAAIHVNDNLVNILEINVGPQYRRQLRNGGYLTLGAGLEAQNWVGAINPIPGFVTSNNAGFAGFSSTIAITR